MTSTSSDANLYGLLSSSFLGTPEAPCLILPDGSIISYRELHRQSAHYAHLLQECGLRKGDIVAAQVGKSPATLYLYLGTLRGGFTYLPLNPSYQPSEIAYFLGDSKPSVFVYRPQCLYSKKLAEEANIQHVFELSDEGEGSLVVAAASQPDVHIPAPCSNEDIASIIYTSGTTGRSKGALLSHKNLATNAIAVAKYWGFGSTEQVDRVLHCLPVYHVHGLFFATHTALLTGSALLWEPKFDAKRVMSLLKEATVFMGVPTYYVRMLLENALCKEACASMRLFVSGSAPLRCDTAEEFAQRTGHTPLERYGMTETGILTSNPYHETQERPRKLGTVGHPLPGLELRIVNTNEAGDIIEAAVGEPGGIQVRGSQVFSGYLNLPEKTREEFAADNFFKTGDIGIKDVDGYVSIVGRSKDLVISGGMNVYPSEVETCLEECVPGVKESAVVGIPHADWGEIVAVAIVLDTCLHTCVDTCVDTSVDTCGNTCVDTCVRTCVHACVHTSVDVTEAYVISRLKEVLAGYKVPKRVAFVPELPRNVMGKVQKNVIRNMFQSGDI